LIKDFTNDRLNTRGILYYYCATHR
jgi:hypothetical protein